METLENLKNTYAQEQGYEDWGDLQDYNLSDGEEMETHMDEICIRAQRVALEKAAENFNLISEHLSYNNTHLSKGIANDINHSLYLKLILNPENLIR